MKVRRRQLAAAGIALAWPLTAAAQPKPTAIVGWLHPGAPDEVPAEQAAFRQALAGTRHLSPHTFVLGTRPVFGQIVSGKASA